jgi:hypothetical protein
MSNGDPTKYNQIAKENTLCDYIKWQTLKLRDCAIEKELMKQTNDPDSDTSSNPNKKLLSRDEFLALVDSGGFKTN